MPIRTSPRWSAQTPVRLGAQGRTATYTSMQNTSKAVARPPNQFTMCCNISVPRPITGQQLTSSTVVHKLCCQVLTLQFNRQTHSGPRNSDCHYVGHCSPTGTETDVLRFSR
ncbi:unnamed protein product [Psylliodes chrysocephalus]|uniref:Uncharacterized protein n=1 Tax=Psylliodes chrysocephalus TaxID=3402493 RepID=A0A9P0D443_9CUCU|nr:unnamed protein product [Psylliodes chrysocephala]